MGMDYSVSGYDYILMNMLEWFDVMEHGSGIRCGWYIGKKTVSDKRRKEIRNMIKSK